MILNKRVPSVDIFRGATILLMILVNTPGTWSAVYAPFLHASWHGYTLTDLVFPFFLFIVGVSTSLSYKDKKLKAPKPAPDVEWIIFEKSMRGDPSDNIFSAYPGVRTKGTKNKIGLQEAYADRKEKGYTWNNLMLSKWVDHEGNEHRVMEDYERNRALVDLHAQPEAIVEELDQTIAQAKAENKSIDQVGIRFMRFCGKYDLNRISEQAQLYVEPFNARLGS